MIESRDYADDDLRVNRAVGAISLHEILRVLGAFYAGKPMRNVLWDFTEAELDDFSGDEVNAVVERLRQIQHSRAGGRTAMVGRTDLQFGLARMFEALSEMREIGFEVDVFRELDEARAWLGVGRS